jgi:hypothetical protein
MSRDLEFEGSLDSRRLDDDGNLPWEIPGNAYPFHPSDLSYTLVIVRFRVETATDTEFVCTCYMRNKGNTPYTVSVKRFGGSLFLVNVANFREVCLLEHVPKVAYAPAAVAALEAAVEHFSGLDVPKTERLDNQTTYQ